MTNRVDKTFPARRPPGVSAFLRRPAVCDGTPNRTRFHTYICLYGIAHGFTRIYTDGDGVEWNTDLHGLTGLTQIHAVGGVASTDLNAARSVEHESSRI